MTALSHMINVVVDKEIEAFTRFSVEATLDLGLIPDNVRKNVARYLTRGYCSALTGQPVAVYQALASAFDFPVFLLGRTDRCTLSLPRSVPDHERQELIDGLKAMYKLCIPAGHNHESWRYWFRAWEGNGHNDKWTQLTISRPQSLTMESLCTFLKVPNIRTLVPLANTMAALYALEQKHVLKIAVSKRGEQC